MGKTNKKRTQNQRNVFTEWRSLKISMTNCPICQTKVSSHPVLFLYLISDACGVKCMCEWQSSAERNNVHCKLLHGEYNTLCYAAKQMVSEICHLVTTINHDCRYSPRTNSFDNGPFVYVCGNHHSYIFVFFFVFFALFNSSIALLCEAQHENAKWK